MEAHATSCGSHVLAILFLFTFPFLFAPAARAQDDPNNEERRRGIELYQQKDYVAASDILKKAVKRNKRDDVAWSYLGFALLQQPKRLKDASKAFETAIKLRPDFGAAHVGLAYSFLKRSKSSEAVRAARIAVGIDPKNFEAHYIIGVVRLQAGDPDEARQEAETAIKINANFAPAHLLKSEALVSSVAHARHFRYTRASSTGGSGIGPGTATGPGTGIGPGTGSGPGSELGPGSGVAPDLEIGVGPGIGTRVWRTLLFAEAAKALETYLQLNPDPEEKRVWSEQLDSLRFHGSSQTAASGNEHVFTGGQVSTRARVLKKPEPLYTDSARSAQIVGTVVLQVVLRADGTVQHILIIEGLPFGLTESAVKAARQIQFTPATFAGSPVSMVVQLEYNFNLY